MCAYTKHKVSQKYRKIISKYIDLEMYHHIIVEISFVKYFEKPQWGALCLFKIILSNLFWMHYLEIKHFPLQTAVSVSSISKKALPMSRIVCQAKNWIYFYSHSFSDNLRGQIAIVSMWYFPYQLLLISNELMGSMLKR